eukprot:6185678-Pyramimonas_sp.AAC.1
MPARRSESCRCAARRWYTNVTEVSTQATQLTTQTGRLMVSAAARARHRHLTSAKNGQEE